MKRGLIYQEQNDPLPILPVSSNILLHQRKRGSETWTLIQADWNKLDSFHVRCKRRILHTRWHDFVSNDEVLRRIGLLASEDWVSFGHVAMQTST